MGYNYVDDYGGRWTLSYGATIEVRVQAIRRLCENIHVEEKHEVARQMLSELFKCANWVSLRRAHAHGDEMSAWLDAKLRLLGSEHGYAIYKAMIAKNE